MDIVVQLKRIRLKNYVVVGIVRIKEDHLSSSLGSPCAGFLDRRDAALGLSILETRGMGEITKRRATAGDLR